MSAAGFPGRMRVFYFPKVGEGMTAHLVGAIQLLSGRLERLYARAVRPIDESAAIEADFAKFRSNYDILEVVLTSKSEFIDERDVEISKDLMRVVTSIYLLLGEMLEDSIIKDARAHFPRFHCWPKESIARLNSYREDAFEMRGIIEGIKEGLSEREDKLSESPFVKVGKDCEGEVERSCFSSLYRSICLLFLGMIGDPVV